MFAALAWAATLEGIAAQDAGPAPAPEGVYTSEQADRGRNEYTTACAHCHSSDLLGDVRQEIPSLAADDFFVRWGGRTGGDLFRMISKDMPADRPGGLTTQAYVDILAYILQVNRYPAGVTELRAAGEQLGAIVFEKQH
jgi:cytochrome c